MTCAGWNRPLPEMTTHGVPACFMARKCGDAGRGDAGRGDGGASGGPRRARGKGASYLRGFFAAVPPCKASLMPMRTPLTIAV